MRKLILVALATIIATAGFADATLVENGTPKADIVIPEKPLASVKVAAEDLQKNLKLISGAELPIVTAPSKDFANHVYVGESPLTRKLGFTTAGLKPEGFKIIVKDGVVALIGRDEERQPFPYERERTNPESAAQWRKLVGEDMAVPSVDVGALNKKLGFRTLDATATLYAVAEFLEQLGVRFYNPYENGTVIPEKKTIVVKNQDLKKEPRFPYRNFTYYGWMRGDTDGVLWFKRLKYGASHVFKNNHTTRDIISPKIQREKHPEYYARDNNGKIIGGHGDGGVPKLSNPEFRDASITYLDKVFENYPPLKGMSVGMPDGFTHVDVEDAKKWPSTSGYRGKFSNYVWDYWVDIAKRLKKTHPDKYLACMAYTTYLEPPTTVEMLPDNVALTMVTHASSLMMPQGKHAVKLRDQWLSMLPSKMLYLWDHYRFYGGVRYPVYFYHQLQEDMKNLDGVCQGKFIEIYPNTKKNDPNRGKLACPGLSHMLHYVQGKLYWDPDLDLDALLDEYYDLYFGPAKDEMKEFYEFAEDVWTRPESRSVTIVSGFLKEKDVERYFDILKRAREKAGKDTVYDKRIAQIENEMAPLRDFFKNLKRTGPDFNGSVADKPVTLDGEFDESFWKNGAKWYEMVRVKDGGQPDENKTKVAFRLTPDKSALLIGVECDEIDMDGVVANTEKHDDFGVFHDDVVEVYIETPKRSYFKVVVNSNGAIWDESQDVAIVTRDTTPTLWEPGTKVGVKRGKDKWTAEIMIPTDDFGGVGPTEKNPWGINVCRTRCASGEGQEWFAVAPTDGKAYRTLSKMGNLKVK